MRAWQDDFLGHTLDARYASTVVGGGSVGLWGPVAGGWVRLANDAVAFHRCYLWLGDGADNYATLSAASGWTQVCKMRINTLASSECNFGAMDAAENNAIIAGYNGDYGANWEIVLRNGGGGWTHVQSTEPAESAPSSSVHALKVTNVGGSVYQIEYWVGGVLLLKIDSVTYGIPAGVLTPVLRLQNRASSQTIGWWDWWLVRPD